MYIYIYLMKSRCCPQGVGKFVSQTGESWIDVAGVGSSSGTCFYLRDQLLQR